MRSNPFFIVGIGRSGTSLIRLMFHSHPRIAIPYESHFLTTYYDNLKQYDDLNEDGNIYRLIGDMLNEPLLKMWDHSFDLERVLGNVQDRSLRGAIHAIYNDYVKGKGKARWGDKSDYLDRMHIINEIFPDAQFIHIIRDGRDVANSVIKLPWGPNDIISAAEWWNQYLWLARRVGAVLGQERYIEVHYEKLVNDTENELKRLCVFLGEEYSSEMLRYYKNVDMAIPADRKGQHYNVESSPKQSRVFAWKREMHPCDVALFNRYAGKMLEEVSYEIPKNKIGKLRLAYRAARIFMGRYFSS